MGVSAEHAISLSEFERFALFITIGEAKGGDWDYEKMAWFKPPQPAPVYAIAAEIKD
jgi:hypothetical protein